MNESDSTALLRLDSVTVAFGGLTVLDDLTLSFGHAPISSLIGPNGAGKTTVFNVFSGIVELKAGNVTFLGEDVTGSSAVDLARRGIVRKFQVPTVFGGLTVENNLKIAAQSPRTGHETDEARKDWGLAEVAEMLGLTQSMRLPAVELAHGERQWLEIGMAFLGRPRFLLLDEPAAGLGPDESAYTAGLIQKISEYCTAIVIEHDMSFIRELGGDVTVLHQGRLLTQGSMEEVEADPTVRDVYLGRDAHA